MPFPTPSPLTDPTLRGDTPLYPHLLQLLRVSASTVSGSSLYRSGSAAQAVLYLGVVQQLQTNNLPRDREPCFADDVNGFGLTPGYYLGRLAGSYQSIPVYEVISQLPPGLTADNVTNLLLGLGSSSPSVLGNLTPCQLQVFQQLNIAQQQFLTANLTATQLTNIVANLTFTQLSSLVTALSLTQIVAVSSSYPSVYQYLFQSLTQTQINTLLASLTGFQLTILYNLTPCQIQTMVLALTTAQIQTLTANVTATQLTNLVGNLTQSQLTNLVVTLTTAQIQALTTTLNAQQIQVLVEAISVSQISTLLTNLTATQLQSLVKYPPAVVNVLVTTLSLAELIAVLVVLPPVLILGKPPQYPWLPSITGKPSSTPNPDPDTKGYASVVVDTNKILWGWIGEAWQNLSGTSGGGGGGTGNESGIATSSTTVSVSNTTTETSLVGTVYGSVAYDTGTIVAGTTFRVRAGGHAITTDATHGNQQFVLRFKLGTKILCSITCSIPQAISDSWQLAIDATVQTTGANGTVGCTGLFAATTNTAADCLATPAATGLVDTTQGSTNFDLTAQWGSAFASNSITCDVVTFEVVRP